MDFISNSRNSTAIFFALSLTAILTALAYEHIGGYKPCPLCLQERYAYYAGTPLSLAALFAAQTGRINWASILIVIAGLGFLINAGLGLYHSGVEWHWWTGPTACTGSDSSNLGAAGGNFLESLEKIKVIRCDEAPWRLLGLSFAGWSGIISLFLSLLSVKIFKDLR